MRLEKVYRQTQANNRERLIADVLYDDGLRDSFFFEYPAFCADDLVTNANPWLVLLLPISVVLREPLIIPYEVDGDLLEGCEELMQVWQCWMGMSEIPIEVNAYKGKYGGEAKTAAFFSGGVDSLYTFCANKDSSTREHVRSIDELIHISGLYASSNAYQDQLQHSAALERMTTFAEQNGKGLIHIHTNVWQTRFTATNSLDHSMGCFLAASVLALGYRYHRVLIPGSVTYNYLTPGGSHFVTDPLLSSSHTRFQQHGCGLTRYDKLNYLTSSGHSIAQLQVCSRSKELENCGECNKCLRTMILLEALGVLDQCELFPHKQLDYERVGRLYSNVGSSFVYMKQAYRVAIERGHQALADVIELFMYRSSWINACHRLIRKLRQGGKPSVGEDIAFLQEMLGLKKNARIANELIVLINALLDRHQPLKDYLLRFMQADVQQWPQDHWVEQSSFRLLEHALFSYSICPSSLDMHLRNPQRELRDPPNVDPIAVLYE